MKKGWIIALCVLLLLGAGAGYGYYRLHGAAQEAEQTQQALYEQYQAMLQNAEQTTLTVTENGETAGTYTLLQLGLLEATSRQSLRALPPTSAWTRRCLRRRAWQTSSSGARKRTRSRDRCV